MLTYADMQVSAASAAQAKGKVKVQFNGSDHLFSQLRDANFEQVIGNRLLGTGHCHLDRLFSS